MLIISKSYIRFLSFFIFCFLTCYALTFLFSNYFIGTDKGYYILLLEKNIDYYKINNTLEPLFFLISRFFSFFDNPEFSLECLKLISLVSKAIFFSILLNNIKNKYIFAILTSILYFLVFYNRSEIGSLRNCYASNVLQFILFFNSAARSYLLTLVGGLFHFATAATFLPYLFILSLKSLTIKSPINQFKSFISSILNFKIYIPSTIKIKFIYLFILFLFFLFIPLFLKPFIFEYLVDYFIRGALSFRFRTLNPFSYYRFYIHLFTLIGILFFYNKETKNKFITQKFNLNLENNLYIIFSYTSIILILSYAPLATVVQRTSYVSMYLCFILSIYYFSKLCDSINKFKLKYFVSFISFFIALSLIAGSSYKYFNFQSYNENIETLKIENN